MPFGLCNTPASFQSYVDRALQGLENELVTYLDDILIFDLTLNKLHKHTYYCLQRLQKNRLYAKLKKYEFKATQTRMLRFIVDKESIRMEQEWILTILDWPELTMLQTSFRPISTNSSMISMVLMDPERP